MQHVLGKKQMVIAVSIAVALLAISILAIASQSSARRSLRNTVQAVESLYGWGCRGISDIGYLDQGDWYIGSATLYSGNLYKIAAAGDGTVRDLDIVLIDSNQNVVDHDTGTDAFPVVEVEPPRSGTYYIVVKMSGGHGYSSVVACYK